MPFVVNLSGTNEVDDSVVKEFDAEFRISLAEQGSASQFASIKRDIGAESISLPKYDQLGLAITPLDEYEDPDSERLVDSKVIVTPQEYGKVVTTTKLANLQTKGMADRAAARLVGINAGRTRNRLAIMAMDANTTNVLRPQNRVDIDAITQTDVMTGSLMGKAYNRLSRKNVLGVANGEFVMLAHEDVIHDIREQATGNSWVDAHKYALPEQLLRNEVGMYKGFRVVRDNLCTVVTNAGGVDVYKTHFIGFNAFGEAISHPIEMRATGPFDKLARFVNLGHYGVYNFKIVEGDALVTVESASSALQE